MKIAQVTECYLPVTGGQQVYVENLNRVFHEAGWRTEVFQPDRGVRRADVVVVPRIRGLGRLIEGIGPYVLNGFLRLGQLPRLGQADVIVCHYAIHAPPLRRFRQRTIILSHGIEWHLEQMTWNDRLHERTARRCLDEFPHVVNDTHYLRHFGYDVAPAAGYFTEVAPGKWFIPNCVDTERFVRTGGLAEVRARNTILVPRQVTADRGITLAIRAFKLLADRHPNLTLHVLGKMHRGGYVAECLDLTRRLGLNDRVIFQDHVEHGSIADYYSSALLTLIPTLRREGTSLSALESMACGTATVSTNVAGLRDLPTLQCDPDEESVAHALTAALAQREHLGREQQATVRAQFNFSNWSAAWRKVVAAVAAAHAN